MAAQNVNFPSMDRNTISMAGLLLCLDMNLVLSWIMKNIMHNIISQRYVINVSSFLLNRIENLKSTLLFLFISVIFSHELKLQSP